MSDRTLRALARRAAQGDLDAGSRLLRERVRVGELSREGIRLAAYCGDPAARAVSGQRPRTEDFERWCEELAMWGPGVCVRAALVMVEHLDPWWRQVPSRWLVEALHEGLLDILECPCVGHERLLRRWQRRLRKTLPGLRLRDTADLQTGEVVTQRMRRHALRCLVETATAALASPRLAEDHARKALRAAQCALGAAGQVDTEGEVRRRVEDALREWALAA